MPNVPDEIDGSERLGRRVSQNDKARRASRDKDPIIDWRAFVDNHPGISIDRLDFASRAEMTSIAESEAAEKGIEFFGWFVVAARIASEKCKLEATKKENNPFHADLWLPEAALGDRDQRIAIAQDLARAANWQPKSTPSESDPRPAPAK